MVDPLVDILDRLPAAHAVEHARALEWFVEHEGDAGPRPWREDGRSVVPGVEVPIVAQRGIHQPSGWDVALTVTATTGSAYLDGKPMRLGDGTWALPYKAHEGGDGTGARSPWNRALIRNMRRRIPVGVFVQEAGAYRNLGLAMVESFDTRTSTFLLRGPVRPGQSPDLWETGPSAAVDGLDEDEPATEPDPLPLIAAEQPEDPYTVARVKRRVAQDRFRELLLDAYDGRCAVTGYDAEDALQGAHILAYSGRSSQRARNGLLLRADVHLLFDRHLIGIEPDRRRIRLAEPLRETRYGELQGQPLQVPSREVDAPATDFLAVHWAVFEAGAG